MFGLMETLFPIFFIVIFVFVIGTFVSTGVKGFSQWQRNNNSPRLTVPATVVNKRTQVGHRHHRHDSHTHSYNYTSYFVTFQVESGDRMELEVPGGESGLLIEGDTGLLTFQGTRYLGFERR
jgi:hypothetical protein